MKLEQSFTVTAPIEEVWAMLVDVERVAPCLPGAQVTGQAPDGSYEGTFSVKLGPATAAYLGHLKMDSLDEASRTATMHANGTDKRGQGGAHAVIVSTLRQEGDETIVDVSTDFSITGRLARFGRGGMIEDISKRLMRDFAECLQSSLAAEPAGAVAPAESAPMPPASEAAQAEAEPPAAEPVAPLGGEEAAPSEAAATATGAPLPGEEAAQAEPAAPLPGEEAAQAEPAAPLGGEEPLAEEQAAAGAPEEPAVRRAGEPDPFGPLSPPAQPAAPAEEAPAQRTHSIPPPSAQQAPPPAKPVKGFSLLFGVLWDRIKRFFARLFGRGRK
jgi:carbon monoxide dehydrogenase subunit G